GYENSLAAFIKTPAAGPIATKMLMGVPLGALGFVGVTEEYESSLNMLSTIYGLNIPVRHDNRNPAKDDRALYEIPEEISDQAEKLLRPEFLLWHRAKALLAERRKAMQEGYEFIHGGILTLNSSNIAGFAYRPTQSRPVRVSVRI